MINFRDKYKNPLFLVTSDDPNKAKNFILDTQKTYKDVFYVGTIQTALDGVITKQDSTGTWYTNYKRSSRFVWKQTLDLRNVQAVPLK